MLEKVENPEKKLNWKMQEIEKKESGKSRKLESIGKKGIIKISRKKMEIKKQELSN